MLESLHGHGASFEGKILVMNPIVIDLYTNCRHCMYVISISGMCTGSFCPADDFKSVPINLASLEKQVGITKLLILQTQTLSLAKRH